MLVYLRTFACLQRARGRGLKRSLGRGPTVAFKRLTPFSFTLLKRSFRYPLQDKRHFFMTRIDFVSHTNFTKFLTIVLLPHM